MAGCILCGSETVPRLMLFVFIAAAVATVQASWASVGDTNTTWSGYHTLSKPSLSALAENFRSPSKSAPGIGADSPNFMFFILSPRRKFPSHYKQNKVL